MELATNTFNKGLLLDTHPMVLGNDTLTDCLNGTLITMNGNEVILLNDMGNRRVDNAFLPSGYEPVGMKEYGGIIYVAAYNPITNKSLIGSFPSPLRKIDSLDDPNLKGTFDFDSFFFLSGANANVERDSYLGIYVIKTDSFMVPLTGETSLRAGDKFAIYSPGISSQYGSSITNFFNTSGNKAYSPKNRRYTLLIGILNSLNEFVDITKTLCRWKNNVIQNYTSEKSEIYKFNDGYFISDLFNDKLDGDTIEDSKLIRKRQKMAANTYAYKLVGPMYLKANLNHIENFNYNIYGTRNDNGSATLWIEGFLNYNCPDGFSDPSGGSNEDYETFSEGTPSPLFSGFDLVGKTTTEDNIIRENSVYNSSNNIYSTKIVKKYTNIDANNGTIYNYVIGVLADMYTSGIYLKGLSVKGQLDLSLLGSGKVFINGWRFYNNFENQSTTLTFSFNAYPEYGKSFGNLKFTFTDSTDPNKTITYPREGGLPLYNGRQTYNIEWGEYFEPRKTYEVTVTYDIINENGTSEHKTLVEKDSNNNTIRRWFLTTELFNDFYLPSSGVEDFCNTGNSEFLSKMTVSLKGSDKILNNTVKKDDEYEGGLTSKENTISYSCKHQYNVNINTNPELSIVDENLYPDYVYVKEQYKSNIQANSVTILKIGNIELEGSSDYNIKFKTLLNKIKGDNIPSGSTLESDFNNLTVLEVGELGYDENEQKIKGTISYYDRYLGYSNLGISDVENVFNTVEELIAPSGSNSSSNNRSLLNINRSSIIDDEDHENGENNENNNNDDEDHENPLIDDDNGGSSGSGGGGSSSGSGSSSSGSSYNDDEGYAGPSDGFYGCIQMNFDNRGGLKGAGDKHFLDVYNKQGLGPGYIDSCTAGLAFRGTPGNSDERPGIFRVREEHKDDTLIYELVNESSKVYSHFSNGLREPGQMFMFMFPSGDIWYSSSTGESSKPANGSTYARVWWRSSDGEWALFDTMINSNQTFSDYIKGRFSKPYVYCMYSTYIGELPDIYATETAYIYYGKYSIPITFSINYGKKTENEVLNVGSRIGNLSFTENLVISNLDSTPITINLDSSQKFLDSINKFKINSVSNIDLSTGLMIDSKGRDLNPNYIYYIEILSDETKRLVRIDNTYMQVDFDNKIGSKGKNTIVYNRNTLGVPTYRYDHAGSGDAHTILDYNLTNIVRDI